MRTETSAFFQPVLARPRERQSQLAAELFVEALEDQLAWQADKTAKSWAGESSLQRPARMIENLALRHSKPQAWADFLDKEIKRKPSAKELLSSIRGWIDHPPESPVQQAMAEARQTIERQGRALNWTEDQYEELRQQLSDPALREFLTQLLGRLAE